MNGIISARYICKSIRFRYMTGNGSVAIEIGFGIVFVARAQLVYNKIQPDLEVRFTI